MARVVLIGGGGHARVLVEAIRAEGGHEIAGVVDAALVAGSDFEGIPVLGADDVLPQLFAEGISAAVVAVGSVGDPARRVAIVARAAEIGFAFPAIVHPAAYVAAGAAVGDGAFVAAGAVVAAGASIGRHAIVNTGAVVDHDCDIAEFVHIAPGAAISGGVHVGARSHVGTGASVVHGVSIGEDSIIGAGAVVVEDVAARVVAYGNPCKIVRERA